MNFPQGPALYRLVRAAFILNDSSIEHWCRANNVKSGWARMALVGVTRSNQAQQTCQRMFEDSKADVIAQVIASGGRQ